MEAAKLQFNYTLFKQLAFIFFIAFIVRAGTFYFFTQYNERYWQADTMDYYNSALCIALGTGMHRVDNMQPIFWRTPGYPWYLSLFYNWYGVKSVRFEDNAAANHIALWVQIFFSSFAPLLVFWLAYLLTGWLTLASVAAWISVFHLGLVLASGYMLTEAWALLFFFLFLIFFYYGFSWWFESGKRRTLLYLTCAAISLAVYTWLRPNGEFACYLSAGMLAFSFGSWQQKAAKIIIFSTIFFTALSPWCYRNYQLTGHWFFCPMSGPYLVTFPAPKIMRRVTGNPLDKCLRYLLMQTKQELDERQKIMQITNPGKITCQELVAGMFAWPWIMKYPHYFILEWMQEVCKTAFDLNASQLVAFAANRYKHDEMEEFLPEKLKLCLYKQPMSTTMRLFCWYDFAYLLWLWTGIFLGFLLCIMLLLRRTKLSALDALWLKSALFIGGLIGMTGGFGYARLRLPVEPLMIILSLTFWFWFIRYLRMTNMTKATDYEISVQPMA